MRYGLTFCRRAITAVATAARAVIRFFGLFGLFAEFWRVGHCDVLAAFRPDTGTVAVQRAMRDKGCEVTHFSAMLDTLDSIQGLIITADALHCRREHACYPHERGAFCYFPVLGKMSFLIATAATRSVSFRSTR